MQLYYIYSFVSSQKCIFLVVWHFLVCHCMNKPQSFKLYLLILTEKLISSFYIFWMKLLWTFVSSLFLRSYILYFHFSWGRIVDHRVFMFNLKKTVSFPKCDCTILYFYQQCVADPVTLHPTNIWGLLIEHFGSDSLGEKLCYVQTLLTVTEETWNTFKGLVMIAN